MKYLALIGVPFFVVQVILSASVGHSAPLEDYEKCGYLSGKALRTANPNLMEFEKGITLDVPLDYSDPQRGNTQIYAFFARKFDPALPTYALLLGGPGQAAHVQGMGKYEFYANLPYNLLLLEQRGIGFSRFETEEQARDVRNSSSEATARDLKAVLDHFHIAKVSVYGTSYGTVPATIFGSLFPERTTSVVLEGVVYDGWLGAMSGVTVQRQIQKFYARLPQKTKDALDRGVAEGRFESWWLPMMIQSFMMQSGTQYFGAFAQALNIVFENPAATTAMVQKKYGEIAAPTYKGSLSEAGTARANVTAARLYQPDECKRVTDSEDVNHLLMIKEFDAADPKASATRKLESGKVSNVVGSNYSDRLPKFTHLEESKISYSASQYPLHVPVIYLQGVADGATANKGAIEHFKKSAKGKAQLFLFDRLGHMPIGQVLLQLERADEQWGLLQKFFMMNLEGQIVSCEMQKELKKSYPQLRFVSVVKGEKIPECK